MTTFLVERLPQPPSMTERFHSEFDSTTSYYPFSHYSAGCSTRRRSGPKRSKKASSCYSYASDSDDESYDMRRAQITSKSTKSARTNSFYFSSASFIPQTSGEITADLAAIERELILKRLHKQHYGSDYDSDESAEDTEDEEYAQWADDFFFEVETLRQQVHASGLCENGIDLESEKRAIRTLYNRNHPNSPVMSRECSAYSGSDSESIPTFQGTECGVHLHHLRKEFHGPEYSDGDESAEDTDDEEYAEWVDDFLREVDELRKQVYASGLCAPGDDGEPHRRCIRSLYNRNHPYSPVMSRTCSAASAYSSD